MGTEVQKTFHRTIGNSAQASKKIDNEEEIKTDPISFAQGIDIAITVAKCAAGGNAFSFAKRNGFSHAKRNGDCASDRYGISGCTRDCNSSINSRSARSNARTL